MQKISIGGIEQFLAVLDLKWRVEFFYVPTETTCRISTHPEQQLHEVWINPSSVQDAGELTVNVVHELCHAKLGEDIDPGFSCWRFSKRYVTSTQAKAELQAKTQAFYIAAAHIDVWVDELRHRHWPELTQLDHDTSEKAILAIARQAPKALLPNSELFMGLCVHLAEANRFGFSTGLQPALKVFDKNTRRLVRELAEYYAALPPLTGEAKTDLRQYEQSVRFSSKRLKLTSINPKIVREDEAWVWTL